MGLRVRDRIIELISEFEGKYIPQSYIHRSLGVSKSRVSEVLSELEKEGLIQRHSIGRVNIVYVKPGAFKSVAERRRVNKLKLGIVYSSEYLFLGFFVKNLQKLGLNVDVVVFNDGFETTRHLAEGLIDIALSPLVGQLYLYPAYRTYRVMSSGGMEGGFRVLYKPGDRGVVLSSMISTMDYVRYLVIKSGLVDASSTYYYRSPSELLLTKKRGYIITWHPVYLKLVKAGYKTILSHEDLPVNFCCSLAISNAVGEDLVKTVSEAFSSALDNYKKNPGGLLEYYSSLTGIDVSILKSAIPEYNVVNEMTSGQVEKIISAFAPVVPDKSVYAESLKRP